jgi:hypothetical protein
VERPDDLRAVSKSRLTSASSSALGSGFEAFGKWMMGDLAPGDDRAVSHAELESKLGGAFLTFSNGAVGNGRDRSEARARESLAE